jgi:hypothetical protein
VAETETPEKKFFEANRKHLFLGQEKNGALQ